MKFICTGGPFGDCMSNYLIEFEKQYTVDEFIDEILKKDEWGCIGIYNKTDRFVAFGNPYCEYSRGKILTDHLPQEYMDKKIVKCKANGGWTMMDYLLFLE